MYPPMVFIHTWNLPMVLTNGFDPWCPPMVSTHGIVSQKKAINNKPHFVKGHIVHHNVVSNVIQATLWWTICPFTK